jgi:hypothetical protein
MSKHPVLIDTFPAGTFIKTEKGFFFVFSDKKRFRFLNKRVLDSWSPHRIVSCLEADPAVSKLRVSSKMKFRNGSLLYSQADGSMYLISDGLARRIKNAEVLTFLNIKRKDAVWVSSEEINLHERGLDISG